jgi:choline dehydrogenase-like flavoprotein
MLEAGKYFPKKMLPLNEIDMMGQLYWNGGAILDKTGRNGVGAGKAVGGGTIAYQGIMFRFDEFLLSQWRQHSGIGYFTVHDLAPYYERAEAYLNIETVDERYRNECSRIFFEAHARMGYEAKPERRAQTNCQWDKGNDCLVCLGGCRINGKQSMPETFLRPALKQGLHLIPEFEVNLIEPKADEVLVMGKYRNRDPMSFSGHSLALAGGPLGNTKLLLKSGLKKKLPALGRNYYVHTQWFHLGLFDREINAYKGPFQVYGCTDMKLRQKGIKTENTFPPPGACSMVLPGFGRDHLAMMRRYKYLSGIETSIRGLNPGSINLDRRNGFIIDCGLTPDDLEREKWAERMSYDMLYNAGARKVVTALISFIFHHYGGLNLSADGSKGCVDPEFHLNGFRNIYCADTSTFPIATGLNPVLSILALSIKASDQIVKEA